MRGSFVNMCPKCWHSLNTSRVLDTFLGETDFQNNRINILIRRRLSQVKRLNVTVRVFDKAVNIFVGKKTKLFYCLKTHLEGLVNTLQPGIIHRDTGPYFLVITCSFKSSFHNKTGKILCLFICGSSQKSLAAAQPGHIFC